LQVEVLFRKSAERKTKSEGDRPGRRVKKPLSPPSRVSSGTEIKKLEGDSNYGKRDPINLYRWPETSEKTTPDNLCSTFQEKKINRRKSQCALTFIRDRPRLGKKRGNIQRKNGKRLF